MDHLSGTPTVILGACGSSTSAVIRTLGSIVWEHTTLLAGTGTRVVGTTPKEDSVCGVGAVVVDGDDGTTAAGPPGSATGTPSAVRAHAANRQASASVVSPMRFISLSRKPERTRVPSPRTACRRRQHSPV